MAIANYDASGIEPFAAGFCQSPSSPATLYSATGANFPGRPVFRSDDFGRSWVRGSALGPAVNPSDCAVDPVRPQTIYVVGFDFDAGVLDGRTLVRVWPDAAAKLRIAAIAREPRRAPAPATPTDASDPCSATVEPDDR